MLGEYNFVTVVVCIKTIKTTLDLNLFISTKLLSSMDTHKRSNKEKLLIRSFFLFNCKLVICEKLVKNQNLKRKVVFIVKTPTTV